MKTFSLIAAVLLSATAYGQVRHTTLQDLRDHNRVLLVFSNGDNALAEAQLNVAATHSAAFRERDLLLVGLSGTNPDAPTALLSAADDAAARKQFHIASGSFTVLLIGKDGGEKLRSHRSIPWTQLQSTIDGMPMRKNEMQNPAASTPGH